MDSSGNIRMLTDEEVARMDDIVHPVESTADFPPEKRALFERYYTDTKLMNRHQRRQLAKERGIDWSEYRIFSTIKLRESLDNLR